MTYQSITRKEFGTRSKRGKQGQTGVTPSTETYAVFTLLKSGTGIRIPHEHTTNKYGMCKVLNRLNVYRTLHDRKEISMKHEIATNDLLVWNFEEDE